MCTPKLNLKAFTLVESLFAVVLIALIAIALFSSLMTSIGYVRRAFELRTASLILQEQMSLVRELQYSDIQSLGGTFSSAYMASLKNAAGTVYKSSGEGSDKILKLTFKLDWTTANNKVTNKPESRSIVTLITDHGMNKK